MNQILSTSMPMDDNKYKARKPTNINGILKFFAIALIIFGTFCAGTGAYSFYKNQVEINDKNSQPSISIENKAEDVIMLKITHKKNISKVEYRWNDQENIVIKGNNGRYVEQEIKIPTGNNTLYVMIYDEAGNEIPYEKQYELKSDINFEVVGSKIKITYSGEKKISYITYRWDDEEEKRIEITGDTVKEEIDAQKGMHTLTVVAVDEDNNTDTKQQKINGVSKPEVQIDIDDEKQHFVISAFDDMQLARIEIRLNQDDTQKYALNLEEMNLKELYYTLPIELKEGENLIEVTVYNTNDVTKEAAARFIKE